MLRKQCATSAPNVLQKRIVISINVSPELFSCENNLLNEIFQRFVQVNAKALY